MTVDPQGFEHGRTHIERIEEASAWCIRLASGMLRDSVRREFETWLAADAGNARAFDQVARTWQSFSAQPLAPELLDMRRAALDRFHSACAAQQARPTSRRWFAALAAAIALVVAATIWFGVLPRSYQTALGERRIVALDDGSSMTLDSQTRVEVHYSGDRRDLRLTRGRAKFSVARDPARPFTVTAANRAVVATGTQFSVELLTAQVNVILYEGSVEVVPEAAARTIQDSPMRMKLRPGHELIASIADGTHELRDIDPAGTLAWETGQIAFDDEPLATAIERMNRYSTSILEVADAAAGRIRISGTFVAGDTETFVEGVTSIFPVRVVAVGDRLVFSSVTSP
jgi:transmembrane sensor